MSIVSACAVCSASGAEELYRSDRALRNRGWNLSLVWHHLQHTETEVSCRMGFLVVFLHHCFKSQALLCVCLAQESAFATSKSALCVCVRVLACMRVRQVCMRGCMSVSK